MRQLARWVGRWEALLVVLLVASVIFGDLTSPHYMTGFNFSTMTSDIMERAIMALPMTLIIIAAEIDLSVASVLGLSSCVLGLAWLHHVPFALCLVLALLTGLVCGWFNGFLVTWLALPSLVVTLGTLALYRGLASVVLGEQSVSSFPTSFTNFGFNTIPGTLIPWPFVVFAVLAVIFIVVLHFSRYGREIYAIGNNKEAALFSAVQVNRIKLVLFIVSGVLSALAGIIFTARFSSSRADNATGFELDVIAAVLLGGVNIFGGRGSLVGVILSLFIIASIRDSLSLIDVADEIQSIVVGSLLILSVLGPNLVRRLRAARTRPLVPRPVARAEPGD